MSPPAHGGPVPLLRPHDGIGIFAAKVCTLSCQPCSNGPFSPVTKTFSSATSTKPLALEDLVEDRGTR